MINQNKILALLNDDFKCPLVEVRENFHMIIVTAPINAANLKRLIEFCDPLHYNVRFDGVTFKGLLIEPRNP